jgi:hypothetical protein
MNKDIHVPRIPKGCDQQGRYPEAAHAASEVEYEPDPWWWVSDIVAAVGLTAVVLFLLILVGLIP